MVVHPVGAVLVLANCYRHMQEELCPLAYTLPLISRRTMLILAQQRAVFDSSLAVRCLCTCAALIFQIC